VAPAVAVLATEGADWCNGQVIMSIGYQIGLFNVPQVTREIVSPGGWDLDLAAKLMKGFFEPAIIPNDAPQPWGLNLGN
jgi:hypothetical protein